MAFELLIETPPLLREGHILKFEGSWGSGFPNGSWWRVERAFQIKMDIARVISTGSSRDFDFRPASTPGLTDQNWSLIPESENTVYEMLLGIKGNVLVYPRYLNDYLLRLETSGMAPDTAEADERYIGFYDEDDSSWEAPRLREHTVNTQDPPVLRLYNDHVLDEKVVFRFIVNRCQVTRVATSVRPGQPPVPAPGELPLTPELLRLARIVRSHSLFRW